MFTFLFNLFFKKEVKKDIQKIEDFEIIKLKNEDKKEIIKEREKKKEFEEDENYDNNKQIYQKIYKNKLKHRKR